MSATVREIFDGDILPVFCPTSQIEFRILRKSLSAQGSATVHGVVFQVFVLGVPLLTVCWQQRPATTIS
ncbi:hypothetical protein SAMN05216338_104356 [Bradyrhizobium sp. Rc2d]|nr:hypothetical protein SAMN05216338_104356 [Bradyrhizobium sp. Rc2d]